MGPKVNLDRTPTFKSELLGVLKRAREVITPKDAWTQGILCRTSSGATRHVGDPDAACFCAEGATLRAIHELKQPDSFPRLLALRYMQEVILDVHGDDMLLCHWNDKHTHEEVLDLFDTAIERLEESA